MYKNSYEALIRRRGSGSLSWPGPAMMLFARPAFGMAAQGVFAAIFAVRGTPDPWRAAAPWIPVYGTLIDAGCLALMWRLTRREGIGLVDLVGLERSHLGRDMLLGLVLVPVSLVFIYGGTYAAGWIVYRAIVPLLFLGGLPLPAALYGVLVWPFIWGLTEQMTYNGYLLPRFRVLCRGAIAAVAIVAFAWSLEHSFVPLTSDPKFMVFRLLASVPHSVFATLVYLKLRRLLPLAFAHALMDGATVLIPLLRG